ncbi:hypothetical protein V511_12240 [Mesotoga sp. Brook.08.YT.4.2.5.1]|uniref:hypothetical protein n=1 Tax=unclassified Mesotoga TaxID=1184398 RepID=UPI000C182F72|nr:MULTISPECIES: hypothetical protein [unclassified Mesotoga]PNE19886.1 hypothetical protein V511_12240 [Mesotoga sp. Brook.08.YT.4.2.5.1]PVD18222.1 hypothetical protein V512_015255 [Mesotoga sp. Brook.08.105.5.1]RAO96553.1 hypothetical protein M388_14235 [Mesotoga sp. Brook.08.YT.4.2.5.4.]RDI93699.1 hypothetical protein Q502_04420 [Mesotoga sp. Brook.08.YT.4.2.5.2.]
MKGAIRFYRMEKFWKKLSAHEKESLLQLAGEWLINGEYTPGYISDDQEMENVQQKAIDVFWCVLSDLISVDANLSVKLYEYLIGEKKAATVFSLYYLHISAMNAYKKLEMPEKAKKAATENLKLAYKLRKEIKKIGIQINPCFHYICKSNPGDHWVEKTRELFQ